MEHLSRLPLGVDKTALSAGEGCVSSRTLESRTHPSPQPSPRGRGSFVWLVAVVLIVAELPRLIAACCAPPGAAGLGTAWFVNDFAQYESAMRQGAEQSGWLVHDAFTAEPHAAAFMFPLYVGIGKLATTLHLPSVAVEHVVEVLAR